MQHDLPDAIIAVNGDAASLHSPRKGSNVSTHRVFLNQDLVDKIMDNYTDRLPPSKSSGTSKKRWALRELSTLSRTFFEAASDHIWRELSSIIPLFNLLPQSEQVEYVLMRPLKIPDFRRWKVYSHRVHVVTLEARKPAEKAPPYPSMQALAMLSAYTTATGELLLPALQHLHYTERLKADELICLTALAPPSLAGLHILTARTSGVFLETVLQHVAEDVPLLRELTLETKLHLGSLWSILSNFTALREAHISVPYVPEHIDSFCSLPALQEGKLSLSPGLHSKVTNEKSNLRCLVENSPNGREIELYGDLQSLVSATPAAVRHGATSLHVKTTGLQATGSWEELLDVISISSSNVRSLSLSDDGLAYSIPLGALWKVMALDSLRSLDVEVDCNVQPTEEGPDQIFHHLCLSAKHKSMPLTTLHIRLFSGEHLGLATLQHVSEHLPYLLDLELAIDSSIHSDSTLDPHADILLAHTTQGHPMQVLNLIDLRADSFRPKEFRLIALLIDCLFPNLASLEAIATGEAPFLGEGWGLIGDMRRDYQRLGKAIVNSAGAM